MMMVGLCFLSSSSSLRFNVQLFFYRTLLARYTIAQLTLASAFNPSVKSSEQPLPPRDHIQSWELTGDYPSIHVLGSNTPVLRKENPLLIKLMTILQKYALSLPFCSKWKHIRRTQLHTLLPAVFTLSHYYTAAISITAHVLMSSTIWRKVKQGFCVY